MKRYAEYAKFDPFCRPDWRFERVLSLVDRVPTPGRCTHRDDELVRKARAFVLRRRNRQEAGLEQLFWEDPGLWYAYQLHERSADSPDTAHVVQARLLAGQDFAEIAALAGMLPETVEWYAALFFDVRHRLRQRDWVTLQVLLPALLRRGDDADAADDGGYYRYAVGGSPFMDGTLKLFAYFGGPFLVDALVAGLQAGRPLQSADDLSRWLDEQWAVTVKRRSLQGAVGFSVNRFNVMELMNTHARIVEIERGENAQGGMAHSALERQAKAMLDEIPFAIGPPAGAARSALEPRDDEIVSGRPLPVLPAVGL